MLQFNALGARVRACRARATGAAIIASAALAGVVAPLHAAEGEAVAKSSVNMPVGATDVGKSIFDLHMLILWICVAIGIGVFGVMLYSII